MSKNYNPPNKTSYDVIIVGGAVIGSSVAYWLTQDSGFKGSVLVVERDSTYEFASTTLSASMVRQQFSNPVNVLISQFAVSFVRDFANVMTPFYQGEAAPDLGFKERGYLFCCTEGGVKDARARVHMQRSLGSPTVFLEPDEISARFPGILTDDLGGASWGPEGEGAFDSTGLMMGLRRGAVQTGAEYVENEVVDVISENDKVTAIVLKTGETVSCGELVNAAGPRADMIAAMAGVHLPVEPRKRYSFTFSCQTPVQEKMPIVIDPFGVYVRPENPLSHTGCEDDPDPRAEVDDFETRHDLFDEKIWPALARRIPQFEAIKMHRYWTGHYAYNTLDQNAVVGRHPTVTNLLFANGFSGHGLQQAPAVGRGIAELIANGEFRTIDMSELGYERIPANQPFLEAAII